MNTGLAEFGFPSSSSLDEEDCDSIATAPSYVLKSYNLKLLPVIFLVFG
jgi:hypothetical protein